MSGYSVYGYSGSGGGYGSGYGEIHGRPNNMKMLQADKKMQALRYSYETLGNLLSTAENFAGLPNEKYSKFNITTNYDYENLKSEFAWELHCFQKARKVFQDKFQCPYEFPKDTPEESIIKDINRYMKKAKHNQDIILFNCMINIIKGEKININFDKLFEELDKYSNSKINPNKLKDLIGPLNQILDKQLEEADKGNMNLNLINDNHKHDRDNLKHISQRNSQMIKVQIGTEGNLIENNNEFIFRQNKHENEFKIKIDYPQFNLAKNLNPFLYTFNKNSGKIYVLPKKGNSYKCYIFENNNTKSLNKDCFEIKEKIEFDEKIFYFGEVKIDNNKNYGLIEESK
jgi:hypothetical protein